MRRDGTRGAVGIEFAFIAPVFFLLLLGIIEVGIMFYSQNVLQNAVLTVGRTVRTGAAQGTAYASATQCTGSGVTGAYTSSQQWFKDQVCCGISSIMTDCTNALRVNVQNYTTGFGTSFTNSTDTSGNLQPVTDAYNPGVSCDVVLMRATYSWPVITPVLSWFLVNMASNKHLLSATAAWRNEPYASGSSC